MSDQGLPEASDEQATPALGSELIASVDSGEPLEVSQLYAGLRQLLDTTTSDGRRVGDCKHGVYLFVDYDGEPIYVGQTREKLRARIGRHLTNQRTDAVAMRVLDPFEVTEIEMWPFWELDGLPPSEIKETLQKAEFTVYQMALQSSTPCSTRGRYRLRTRSPCRSPFGARSCRSARGVNVVRQVRF